MSDTIKVLIVDDSAFARSVIAKKLGTDPSIAVAGFARDGADALEKIKELKPDVVTMDIILPGMNGIEATRQIKMLYPQIKIIMVSALGGELREQAAAAGADGYVPKELAHEALVDSVADVVSK